MDTKGSNPFILKESESFLIKKDQVTVLTLCNTSVVAVLYDPQEKIGAFINLSVNQNHTLHSYHPDFKNIEVAPSNPYLPNSKIVLHNIYDKLMASGAKKLLGKVYGGAVSSRFTEGEDNLQHVLQFCSEKNIMILEREYGGNFIRQLVLTTDNFGIKLFKKKNNIT